MKEVGFLSSTRSVAPAVVAPEVYRADRRSSGNDFPIEHEFPDILEVSSFRGILPTPSYVS